MTIMASSAEPEVGRWAAIARKEAAVKVDVPLLQSTAGLKTVVVDANALIGGGVKLAGLADQFVTVREVLEEVRDPASRFYLATLPVTIRCLEPSSEALAAVIKFSRATGDFQSLSAVDLKLIALSYALEAEVHGAANIRSEPLPLLVSHSITREKNPPGWGTVENAEDWEFVEENEPPGSVETKSRILGLKSLNSHLSHSDNLSGGSPVSNGGQHEATDAREHETADDISAELCVSERAEQSGFSAPDNDSQPPAAHEGHSMAKQEESGQRFVAQEGPVTKPSSVPEKPLLSHEGKLNVAEGVDASKGDVDEDGLDWQRASCRSTRRNYLKREAKRSARRQAAESANAEMPYSVGNDDTSTADDVAGKFTSATSLESGEVESEIPYSVGDDDDNDGRVDDTASNCTDAESLRSGGVESEESWRMAPLWKSSIACMTTDFAMQNVLLQMGLRLLSLNGMHIRELNKWVLKCQACNHVVSSVGRLFCPKCGNGGTLFKVAVTVGQNGIVHSGRAHRVNLRGTRYSLPMPKGGREGAAQNPILREDQLPRARKTSGLDNSALTDVNFTNTRDKGGQNLAGVKTAAAVFGGRRNPNDRRSAAHRG